MALENLDRPEIDAAWFVELYLAVHGGDPAPGRQVALPAEVVEAAKALVRTMSNAFAPGKAAHANRVTTIGLEVVAHDAHASMGGAAAMEKEARPRVIQGRCYYFEGTPAICLKNVVFLDH